MALHPYAISLMIKNKLVKRESQEPPRFPSKTTKKDKPKLQSIIAAMKAHIQSLEREIDINEASKDSDIKRLQGFISSQAAKIRQLELENHKLILRVKNSNRKSEQENVSVIHPTLGHTERDNEYTTLRNQDSSKYNTLGVNGKTPIKSKENRLHQLPIFSRSTLDMVGPSSLPHRFNLSSEIEVPLINVFNTEAKDSVRGSRIVCRSLKNEYRMKSHKCSSRCNSRMDDCR